MIVLTPEANAEVRRNILLGIGAVAGSVLLVLALVTAAIVPAGGTDTLRFVSLFLMAFLLPILSMLATSLTLAYLLDAWPGFLRSTRCETLYGIKAGDVSSQSNRRWMKHVGYWVAFAKGAVVAAVFVLTWLGTAWTANRKPIPDGYIFPALMIILFAGSLVSRAWVVRKVYAERVSSLAPGVE